MNILLIIVVSLSAIIISLSVLISPFVIKEILLSYKGKGIWRYIVPIGAGLLFHYFSPIPAIAGSLVFLAFQPKKESLTRLSNALMHHDPVRALGPEWEPIFHKIVRGTEDVEVVYMRKVYPVTMSVLTALSVSRNPEQIHIIRTLLQSVERASAGIRMQMQSLLIAKAFIPITAVVSWFTFYQRGMIIPEIRSLALVYQLLAILIYELGIAWVESISPTSL